MNEEEKFVIKMLKDSQNTYIENTKVEKVELSADEVEVVLNLIQKQEEEIERLEEAIEQQCFIINNEDYISKDKIRKLKENMEISIEDIKDNLEITHANLDTIKELEYKIDFAEDLLREK